jgi:hypothetical protein
LVNEGCPSLTSLGITRSFPRLCPFVGLVTVALLTLAPLPLRGARLACLIHAANVHSEPGSNPSIKVEFPRAQGPLRLAPKPNGLRITIWSWREPLPSLPTRHVQSTTIETTPAGFPQGYVRSHNRTTYNQIVKEVTTQPTDDATGRSTPLWASLRPLSLSQVRPVVRLSSQLRVAAFSAATRGILPNPGGPSSPYSGFFSNWDPTANHGGRSCSFPS